MPVIVVGGQTKGIGKTTLICNIVSAFRERGWTAVKISDHRYNSAGCKLVAEGAGWSIQEQVARDDRSDTARFLHAGAARALLVHAEVSALQGAAVALLPFLSGNVIVESNRAVDFLSPDLFLLTVDAQREIKPSAELQLKRADALVWRGAQAPEGNRPSFPAAEGDLDPRLESLIRKRLA